MRRVAASLAVVLLLSLLRGSARSAPSPEPQCVGAVGATAIRRPGPLQVLRTLIPRLRPTLLRRAWRATETVSMLERYHGEQADGVRYLDAAQREHYRLTLRGGKLYDSSGALFDTRDANVPIGVSTAQAIFVLGPNGELYAAKDHAHGVLHHSSFLAGGDVAAAGSFEVVDGVLKSVSNHSGHYKTPSRLAPQLMRFFASRGIDTGKVHVARWAPATEPPAPHAAVEVTPAFLRSVEQDLLTAIHVAEQRAAAH